MASVLEPTPDSDIDAIARSLHARWWTRFVPQPAPRWWLTRFVFLRLLAFVYLVAFVSLERQLLPLLGSNGLLPIQQFLGEQLAAHDGSRFRAAMHLPTLFWIGASDTTLRIAAGAGIALSLAALAGITNVALQFALWALYLSFVNVGQIFYGYGWETLLTETGFLATFLCGLRSIAPFASRGAPPAAVFWLLRWLAFRVMFGAGLIKLRGDPCWRQLTCLAFHYETQPIPNPLSPLLHAMPSWFHATGVLFNHFVELVVPWFVFGPRRVRHTAGVFLVAFQLILIASGNLAFLNWITLTVCIACFDDSAFRRLVPRAWRSRIDAVPAEPVRSTRIAAIVLVVTVALLSVAPVANMISSRQVMNATFDPLRLVNTYGAFGSVGRARPEIVIEGTRSATLDASTRWEAYEFPCKPGDPRRRPCWISPYHYRLDWQMWFAAMSSAEDEPWLMHLVWKLLHGDRGVSTLFARDPFRDGPPRYVRVLLYRYRFHRPRAAGEPWWDRELVGEWLPPMGAEDPDLRAYVDAYGWRDGRARE